MMPQRIRLGSARLRRLRCTLLLRCFLSAYWCLAVRARKFQFRLSALSSKQENAPWCTGAAAPSLPPGVVLRAANQNPNDCRGQSYLNFQVSSAARLMRNGDTNRVRIRFVKKVLLETLYVLIYRCPISESVAVPHPPLRGTFPPGEGICRPNYRFPICCFKPIT